MLSVDSIEIWFVDPAVKDMVDVALRLDAGTFTCFLCGLEELCMLNLVEALAALEKETVMV